MDVSNFDLAHLPGDYIEDPYRYMKALRESDPIHRMGDGSFLLTRYADICDIYRAPDIWSSDKKKDFHPKFGDSPLYEHHTTSVVFIDPPDHTRIRALFQSAFTRKALAALESRIETLVDEYLDKLEDTGAMEVVNDFSFRLPMQVVAIMLGVPREDMGLIRDWAVAILTALEPVLSQDQLDTGNKAVVDFKAYLRDLVAHRKAHPTDGSSGEILTALIEAEQDGQTLTELELLHQCIFLLNAGHETTTNMISHGVHQMLLHPDELARLRADPALIKSCVEEILRYQPPIQINNRRARTDTEVGGVSFPEGSVVHLMIPGANRDPAQFPDPDRFDIGRRNNRHVSFALGIHVCIGNSLARLEGAIAFGKLFSRFPTLHMTGPIKLSPRVRFREVEHLPVAI